MATCPTAALVICAFVFAAVVSAAETPRAVPAEGAAFRGELTAADAQWQLTFAVEGKPRTLPAADLAAWGNFAEPADGTLVLLADGGLLPAKVLGADKEHLALDSAVFGGQKVPLESLAGIVFQLPPQRQDADRLLDRVWLAAGDADRLLLTNGDEVRGFVESLDAGAATIRAAVGAVKVETPRIAAAVFNPTLRQTVKQETGTGSAPPRLGSVEGGGRAVPVPVSCWVGLSDGGRLLAGKLLLDDKSLGVTALGGQTWKAAAKDLVALQPLGGRAVYLSDLKPAGYRYTPFLAGISDHAGRSFTPSKNGRSETASYETAGDNGTVPLRSAGAAGKDSVTRPYLPWPYRPDRNVAGGLLRCGGRLYLKGLGMHSRSQLTYALDPSYRRFEAELGVDDSTAGGGSVQFRVLLDGREKFAGKTLRGGDPPVAVSVDLSGAKTLELLVDYADRGDVLDRAAWLDARLVK